MGLDMYAYSVAIEPTDTVELERSAIDEFHHWRKHLNLHFWMYDLHLATGGCFEDLESTDIRLQSSDLDLLESVLLGAGLPDYQDGVCGYSGAVVRDDDLAFIVKARAAIAAGRAVYYAVY